MTVTTVIIIIQFNYLLFMCRVNSYKAIYRHSTVKIQVIALWTKHNINSKTNYRLALKEKRDNNNVVKFLYFNAFE
jgi:hypothetical protein